MSDPADRPNARRFPRAPLSLEVHFRTKGSFLVSYSLNLSKGGLFLETDELLPVGTNLTVRFSVPGTTMQIETEARVMWVRSAVSDEGLPPGLGLQFDRLEQRLGAVIDKIVQDFAGMKLMAVAADDVAAERLSRYLRSILTCDVAQAIAAETTTAGYPAPLDLVLVDLDSSGDEGIAAIRAARQRTIPPIPVIALSRSAASRTEALVAGAAAVLENPPAYDVLRDCVLDVLGRPDTPRRA